MRPIPPPPGFTELEQHLLQGMISELHTLVALPDWEQRLPFTVRRAYVLERLGNPVELTLKLYQRASKRYGQAAVMLLLEAHVLGTGHERWAAANGGLVLCHHTAPQVAAAIRAYHTAIRPVQEQVARYYQATFYNA